MKTALHVLLGLIQLALALPFLVSALWYLYTGEPIFAFTDEGWTFATVMGLCAAIAMTTLHLEVE